MNESDLPDHPIVFFEKWFNEAIEADVYEPNAMVLSTLGDNSTPDSRVVLLKDIEANSLSFYTNYLSAKGMQMEKNNKVALLFLWTIIHRQVRIRGIVEKISAGASDEYFKTRPRASQIGAWSSAQSEVIPGRDFLEKAFAEKIKEFSKVEIPRPEHWGGYRVEINKIEFWQGRRGRLHDRLVYEKMTDGWSIKRLSP